MDQSLNKKLNLKEAIFSLIKNHKLKFSFLISVLLIFIICILVFIDNEKRKNIIISEKYIKAGLLLSSSQNEDAKQYYEDIILSKNKFYSLLALNIILEKNLVSDNAKILEYFKVLEKHNYSEELNDLIVFKKALFLLKNKDDETGKKLLNFLINKNSNLKSAALQLIR